MEQEAIITASWSSILKIKEREKIGVLKYIFLRYLTDKVVNYLLEGCLLRYQWFQVMNKDFSAFHGIFIPMTGVFPHPW